MRREKKYHYIYKTTCKVTDKFYVGMHSTDNLEDGYIGSGKRLWHSIRKHGLDNHVKEILEFLPNRSSLKSREKEIVNERFLQDTNCLNIQIGGGGGFSSKEHYDKFVLACKNNGENQKKLCEDEEYRKNIGTFLKNYRPDFSGANNGFYGKTHNEETKVKLREIASNKLGDKNSQHGTCWITNGAENKKIKRTDELPSGWSYGRKIKN
jgi:hypothetical protein